MNSGNNYSNEMPEGGWRPQGNGPHTTVAGNMFDPAVNADGAMHGSKGVGGTDEETILKEGEEHIHRTGGVGFDGQPPNVSSNAYDQGYGRGGISGVSSSGVHQEGIDHIRSEVGLGQSDRYGAGSGYDSNTTGRDFDRSGLNSERFEGREGYSGANDTSTRSGLSGSNANTRDQATVGDVDNVGSQAREGTAQGGEDMGETKQEREGQSAGQNSSGHHVGGYIGNPEMDANTSGPPDTIPMAGGERIGTKHWGESKVIKDTPLPKSEQDAATAANTEKNAHGKDEGQHKESMMEKIKDKMGMGHHEK